MSLFAVIVASAAVMAGAQAAPPAGRSAAATGRPVELSRVVVDIEPGTRIGKYKSGSICLSGDKFLWKRGSAPELDPDLFEDSFRSRIRRLGFASIDDPGNLFAGVDTDGAEYLVAAKVEAIDVSLCYPDHGLGSVEKSKGRASVRVTWQIYSRAERAVVASFTATGASARPQSQAGGPHAILMDAFGDSLRRFTEQPSFRAIYGSAAGE